MRNLPGRTGIRALAIAAIFGVGLASSAIASPISATITYQTTGTIGFQPSNADSPIQFHGVDNGSFVSSTSFNLGEFEVVPSLFDGPGPSRVDIPFTINYSTKKVDGAVPTPNVGPVVLKGRISGVIDEAGQPHLSAIFDQGTSVQDPKYFMPAPPFQTGDLMNTIHVNHSHVSLDLSTTDEGLTSVAASIDVAPVPEPTTLSIFALLAIGLGFRHRSKRAH